MSTINAAPAATSIVHRDTGASVACTTSSYTGLHLSGFWVERLASEAGWDGEEPALVVAFDYRTWLITGQAARHLARLIGNGLARTLIPAAERTFLGEITARNFPASVRRSRRRPGHVGKGFVASLTRPVDVLAQHGLGAVLGPFNPYRRRNGRYIIPQSWGDLDLSAVKVGGVQ